MKIPLIRDITRDLPDLTPAEEQAVLKTLASVLAGKHTKAEVEWRLLEERRGMVIRMGCSLLGERSRRLCIQVYELLLKYYSEYL